MRADVKARSQDDAVGGVGTQGARRARADHAWQASLACGQDGRGHTSRGLCLTGLLRAGAARRSRLGSGRGAATSAGARNGARAERHLFVFVTRWRCEAWSTPLKQSQVAEWKKRAYVEAWAMRGGERESVCVSTACSAVVIS